MEGGLKNERLQTSRLRGPQIIEKAVSNVHYIDKARPIIAEVIADSYIAALTWTHGQFKKYKPRDNILTIAVVSLACALTGFIATISLRRHKL